MKQDRVCEICCHTETEGVKRIRRHNHPCSGRCLGWICSRCTSLVRNLRYSPDIARGMKAYMDKFDMQYSQQKIENAIAFLERHTVTEKQLADERNRAYANLTGEEK